MSEKNFKELMDQARSHPAFPLEMAILEFTEALYVTMEQQGISQAELARRLGTSRAYVTKALRGNVNFTLATMSRLAAAAGAHVRITLEAASTADSSADRRTPEESGRLQKERQSRRLPAA
jgi:transcriptional regulator with XRE-family HTH domain